VLLPNLVMVRVWKAFRDWTGVDELWQTNHLEFV